MRLLLCLLLATDGAQALWPAPSAATWGMTDLTLSPNFVFTCANAVPDILTHAFTRYASLTRPRRWKNTTASGMVGALVVSVDSADEAPPQLGTDESYTLIIGAASSSPDGASSSATLHAATVYGALRGLETFSQLVTFDPGTATYAVEKTPLRIDDAPRFPHRGFMVDTSRHWQSIAMLKRLVDSLSFAKLNTLHWHVVDDQSFPLTVRSFPNLQGMGAYSVAERYSPLDVEDIVEYARLRGVRVLL